MILLPNSNSDFSGTCMYFLTPLIDIALIGDSKASIRATPLVWGQKDPDGPSIISNAVDEL